MSDLKMLTSKEGLRVKKLLGISDELFEEFKEAAKESDAKRKHRHENRLVVDNSIPKIFIKKGIEKEFAEFYNKNIEGNFVANYILEDVPVKEGYITLSFLDFLNIIYPDEGEVMYMIQQYQKPELLEQVLEFKERIEGFYKKIVSKFEITNGLVSSQFMWSTTKNVKITEATVDEELFDDLDEIEMSAVNTEFTFHIETHEDEDSFGYRLEEMIANDDTVPTITLMVQTMVYMLNKHADEFLITKDNLNQRIRKSNNEEIDLHRELKQHLKKSNVPVYYIDKIIW